MSDERDPAEGPRGPCLRCTISALLALVIGAWLVAVLVRAARAAAGSVARRARA